MAVCKQCCCPLAWTVDRGESFSLFAASVMSDHQSTTGTFFHTNTENSAHIHENHVTFHIPKHHLFTYLTLCAWAKLLDVAH